MPSGNDAAILIAENIGGSVEGFADMMNEEAQQIGATGCHFKNPHGLTEDDHYVTAYDMYLIFNEALKYDVFNEIINTQSYSTIYYDAEGNPKEYSCETTNQYLKGNYQAPGHITVIGGKTGTTNAAQNCLVLLSRDAGGNPYISVIMKCSERGILYEEMTDMLGLIE
jgi:D-alanyl-D-alanine carboxypeptidase